MSIAEEVRVDVQVVEALERAGVDVTFGMCFPRVGIELDREGRILAAGDEVAVIAGEAVTRAHLQPASRLFTGDATPPEFPDGPTPEFVPFFAVIEVTAADFCSVIRPEEDREFERIYRRLRRDPDATAEYPLLSYVLAGARLYMSLRPTSRAEYEGVMSRLARSARTYSTGRSSTNYFDYGISALLDGRPRKRLPARGALAPQRIL